MSTPWSIVVPEGSDWFVAAVVGLALVATLVLAALAYWAGE